MTQTSARYVAFLLLLACVCLPFAAMAKTFAKTFGRTLDVAISTAPITFDSRFATDATSQRMLHLITHGLVKLDDNFQPTSAIADFQQDNFTTFTFKIKDGVKFHDGTPLTAAYVKDFYKSILAEDLGSPLKGALKGLKRIEIPAEKTVVFQLEEPNPFFWSALSIPLVKIHDTMAEEPIGVGRFALLSLDNNGNTLLERVKPRDDGINHIQFSVVKDPVVRLLKLMRGEVEVIHNDMPEELVQHAQGKGFNLHTAPSASYTYIGFNLAPSVKTGDVKLRKAISHAINREEIINYLLGGRARTAESLLVEGHPAYWAGEVEAYNPAKARTLLKQAGYDDIELKMAITTNPFILRLSQILKQQLAEAGIHLDISSSEWGTFYGNIKKGNFESYILTWVGKFQPDIFNALFHSAQVPPHGANRGRYINAEMDEMIDTIMTSTDEASVNDLARRIQQKQYEDVIYVPLWRRDHVLITSPDVKSCKIDAEGGFEGLLACRNTP